MIEKLGIIMVVATLLAGTVLMVVAIVRMVAYLMDFLALVTTAAVAG